DPDLPRSARDSRAKRRKDLKEAAELMTQVAYEDEQPGASLVVDYLRLRGYTNIADTVAPGLFAAEAENALNPPDASALGTIARIIETLDDTKLRAARNVIAIWAGINLFLALGLIGESLSLPLYQVMEADDGIRFIRDAVGLFPSQGQIAGVLVSLAMADWWLEAAWEYGVAVFGIVARTATAAFALAKADPEAVRFMKLVADVDLAAAPGPYTDLPVSLELLEAKAETAFASLEWDDPAS
ncbi:MAG TPA: hypothetical protein VNL71_08445, partial [Chloroflexota bacterium]|nr:hypothetical protein [Chloroflexota bacterium]